jgi:hypothetical protein
MLNFCLRLNIEFLEKNTAKTQNPARVLPFGDHNIDYIQLRGGAKKLQNAVLSERED